MPRTGGADGANDSHADMLLSYPIIHLSNLIITTLSYQFLSDKLCKLSQAETAQSYPIELLPPQFTREPQPLQLTIVN